MSPQTTWAPSEASRRAVARPMPLPAPVITAVRPPRRRQTGGAAPSSGAVFSGMASGLRGDEDVLGLGEGGERVGAELAPEARLAEAAERGPVADAGVGVDGEV